MSGLSAWVGSPGTMDGETPEEWQGLSGLIRGALKELHFKLRAEDFPDSRELEADMLTLRSSSAPVILQIPGGAQQWGLGGADRNGCLTHKTCRQHLSTGNNGLQESPKPRPEVSHALPMNSAIQKVRKDPRIGMCQITSADEFLHQSFFYFAYQRQLPEPMECDSDTRDRPRDTECHTATKKWTHTAASGKRRAALEFPLLAISADKDVCY
ncbi:hypothetical protein HNY73_022845 [Argiope bruennichi]|uniref:Uncharacterized protein n=1 Tax=Argiope bruennichi TaxID=94029 RepID=A0A8T0E3G3_ARGBR|nr:hypothetical protein HNY73_022845 [Argiope bruennichi]